MSAPDLLKVFMLVGILLAICGIRWLNREIARLAEENRRKRACMNCSEESP
jgi:hypothetical protein